MDRPTSLPSSPEQHTAPNDLHTRLRPWLLAVCAVSTMLLLAQEMDYQPVDAADRRVSILVLVAAAAAFLANSFALAQEVRRRRESVHDDRG